MRKIQLTQGQVALVDDEDFERLNQFKWHVMKKEKTFYASRGLPKNNWPPTSIKMHHAIIGKPPKGFVGDHKDGNGLNNQRENLRHVTKRQNQQNRKHENSSSRFPGVSWSKVSKMWRARITIKRKQKWLGLFTDEFKAFEAYKQAAEAIGEEVVGEIN